MIQNILNLRNLSVLVLILAAWLITAYWIEPFLHYHSQQTGFLFSRDFLRSYTTYPGGWADYMAEFISQFFFYPLSGSFLVVAVAALPGFLAMDLATGTSCTRKYGISVFGVILLFGVLVMTDYRYPYYATVRLLCAFVFTWVFALLHRKNPKGSLFIWPVAAFLLFYLASGPALFVFSLSTSIIILSSRDLKYRAAVIPAMLLFAAFLPFLGYRFLYPVTLGDVYKLVVVRHPELLAYTTFYQLYIYYSLLPVILLIFFFVKQKPELLPEPKQVTGETTPKQVKGETASKVAIFKTAYGVHLLQMVILLAAGYFLFVKSFDPEKKRVLQVEYLAENGQWNELLKAVEKTERYDFRVNFQVNRAYAHLGQLPERLFAYPQLLGVYGLFYDNSTINGSLTMPNSDLYFDLGLMSESLHWAYEAQTLMPNSPRILKRLVMASLVNRQYKQAEQFLAVLDRNLLCRDWVARYRPYLTDTALAAKDNLIAEKRLFNPTREFIHLDPLSDLKFLLETNPENRFAYDYLITHTQLSSNFTDFMTYLPRYTSFGLQKLPRSWEEMLAVEIMRNRSFPDFITPETFTDETLQRFGKFNAILKQFNNDVKAARSALQKDFEKTYWYYILYLDPKVTQVLKNKTLIR
ncbi:MAG TPA: DUF6057 family protein [Prolixibacteraceae bacterium]|nr:DUF6057 family protein [Prolixibacteraceae bacterium]HOS01043.1 DUF6057 family protein [Prolixibacteraceae bacterium]HOS89206.1 DUF6057 family protein [Prolixibacteraceae bacterium]HPL46177.1 DUF6057 family protein [Prolixibacteraceae bacterium]HQE52393.1 DUF6057 family protein [Prolixibacteraceae bacterium]